jgi:hypothetical protein
MRKSFDEQKKLLHDRYGEFSMEDRRQILCKLRRRNILMFRQLERLKHDGTMVDFFLQQRKIQGIKMASGNLISAWMIQQDSLYSKKMLRGYYLERKIVDEYEETEKITTFSANNYRKNINLLESYTMNKPMDDFSFRFAIRAKKRSITIKKAK